MCMCKILKLTSNWKLWAKSLCFKGGETWKWQNYTAPKKSSISFMPTFLHFPHSQKEGLTIIQSLHASSNYICECNIKMPTRKSFLDVYAYTDPHICAWKLFKSLHWSNSKIKSTRMEIDLFGIGIMSSVIPCFKR